MTNTSALAVEYGLGSKTQFRTRISPAGNLLVDRRNKTTGEWRFNGYARAKVIADILVGIDLAEWVVEADVDPDPDVRQTTTNYSRDHVDR